MADQHVDAYFKNEDDALEAQSKLEIAGAKDLTVEKIPEDDDGLFIPLFAFAGTGGGTTTGSGVGAAGGAGVSGAPNTSLPAFLAFADEEDDIAERHVLCSFVIDEQKYKETLSIIEDCGGKVYE